MVVGDPHRVQDAALLLEKAEKVGDNREYVTFTGLYAGQQVTICSHGVGAAGASVCFAELIQAGVSVIIRAGTCGALQPEIDDGSLVIGCAAIREDGTSDKLVPLAYPAYVDDKVLRALQESALARNIQFYKGVVLTQAYLYPALLPFNVDLWSKAGAVCVEMELAVLLVLAGINKVKAGGIFISDGNLARQQQHISPQSYDPHRTVVTQGIQTMIQVTLDALVRLPEE